MRMQQKIKKTHLILLIVAFLLKRDNMLLWYMKANIGLGKLFIKKIRALSSNVWKNAGNCGNGRRKKTVFLYQRTYCVYDKHSKKEMSTKRELYSVPELDDVYGKPKK
nr:unnamed protein product [Callosobruchus analis]